MTRIAGNVPCACHSVFSRAWHRSGVLDAAGEVCIHPSAEAKNLPRNSLAKIGRNQLANRGGFVSLIAG